MKSWIGTSEWLTPRWTVTKQDVICNSSSTKYPRLVFEFKVLLFFFSGSFHTINNPPLAGKKHSGIWCSIFHFHCGFSWQFCRLVLRGIQISGWISSTVFLENVVRNLLPQSKLLCATFFSVERIPTLGFSPTFTPFLWDGGVSQKASLDFWLASRLAE